MIRKIALATIVISVLSAAACGAPEPTAETRSDLFVSNNGPFACYTGAIPGFGFMDEFDQSGFAGNCQRYRADFNGGSQSQGFQAWSQMGVKSIRFSPQFTSAVVCPGGITGPPYAPCAGQTGLIYGGSGNDLSNLNPASVTVVALAVYPPCPSVAGLKVVHQCTGAATPYDASGYATAVVADGSVSPGLPFGHPLNLPNANLSSDDDCIVDLATLGLQSQFVYPAGYPYGTRIAAVYSCP